MAPLKYLVISIKCAEKSTSCLVLKCANIHFHRVYWVPGFLPSRSNWVPHPLPFKRMSEAPRGETHSLLLWRGDNFGRLDCMPGTLYTLCSFGMNQYFMLVNIFSALAIIYETRFYLLFYKAEFTKSYTDTSVLTTTTHFESKFPWKKHYICRNLTFRKESVANHIMMGSWVKTSQYNGH